MLTVETVEVALAPKAIKRKNTSSPELQTPPKMIGEQASLQRERLEDVFQDEIIIAFADITSFKKFARSKNGLCLSQSYIKTIVEDHEGNVQEQKLEILFKWREIQGEKATVREIRHLLQKYFRKDDPSGYIDLENGIFGVYKTCFLCKRSNVYFGVQISEVTGTQTRAIKFVPKNEKILREAQILAKLGNHVNVVSIIHAGIYHANPHDYIYIAMEHSWTQTVRNMIEECMGQQKPFQEFIAWSLVEQLMKAVEFLHSHNIIHRDVKPENVLASDDWRLFKVTDFGLSKVIQDGSATNQTNANTGTEGYRSRETYNLEAKITVKTDIFSAGATIGEIMANGIHPFGDDPDLWTYNIKKNNINLSHLCVVNKDQVISLIKPMLEMDPEKRPTAKKVLNDVSRLFLTFQLKNQQTAANGSLATTSKPMTELSITEKVNAIIMFNHPDKHMYSFNLLTKEWRRMQEFPEYDDSNYRFTTVVSGKHIYFFQGKKFHQREHSNPAAEWKEMSSTEENHGADPPAVLLNGFIYVCGRKNNASRSVERYDAALDRWYHMCDMNTGRRKPCFAATEDHIYCMGGWEERSIERFDEKLNKWEFVKLLPRPIMNATAAVVKNRIYVADCFEYERGVLCYDIQNNSWSDILQSISLLGDANILAVDDELYIIGFVSGWDGTFKSAIYLLEPETEQMILVDELEDKKINYRACLAVKL